VQTGFDAVRDRLLKIGGSEVKQAPGRYDPAIDELLRDGREISLPVLMRPMEPQHCHANVARLWQQHAPSLVAISAGYALDADGYVWRQHWWGLATDIGIIETTEPRSRYFGIDFTGEAANAVTTEILREFEAHRGQ
jgi:hypothetical protein